MTWIKKGNIFNAYWAQLPVVDVYPDHYKIYYSTRDKQGRSKPRVSSFTKNLVIISDYPVDIPLGKPGSFDADGVMPSSIYTRDEDGWKFMYYVGWSKRVDVPYWNSMGVVISEDGGVNWRKCSEGPYLASNPLETGFIGTVEIDPSNPTNVYYSSAHWENIEGKLEPIYDIKISRGGRIGETILKLKENEGGIASFRQVEDKFYYSKRNKSDYRTNSKNSYKIYSCNLDGNNEQLELSPSGDELMCAYPFVIEEEDKFIMFYNSDFGQAGISYAIKMK
jgi:hypothetical protein